MSEEDALLRAICEQPDEDTPRLVFADWLSEQGGAVNTAWAKGIRAMVRVTRDTASAAVWLQAGVFQSRDRLREVLSYLRVSDEIRVREWERGFPAYVTSSFANMSAAWTGLVFRVPVRTIQLSDSTDEAVAQFVSWPGLSRITSLSFDPGWTFSTLSDASLLALTQCSGFSALEALKFGSANFSEVGLRTLLDSPHLTRLKRLEVSNKANSQPLSLPVRRQLRARFGPKAIL